MVKESAAVKADRYLIEGRIILKSVTSNRVDGIARGDGHLWRFGYQAGEWFCDCYARSDGCCHLRAVRKVTAVDVEPL